MIYQMYQAEADRLWPLQVMARSAAELLRLPWPLIGNEAVVKGAAAAADVFSRLTLTHERPAFGIDRVRQGNGWAAVAEEVALSTPFGSLLHFRKDTEAVQPRVLVVAPMSGHFATLLRDTVETMLADHDVWLTDWHNVRDVPLDEGDFGFEDFVSHLIRFLEVMGPGSHIVAVCQPTVAALAAVALMAEDGNPAQPRSMTLMAGPIDTRVNPTKVNELATEHSIDWFRRHLVDTVPLRYKGAFRQVYPGFMQITAFMTMNLDRHVRAFLDMYNHEVAGDVAKAAFGQAFYAEYFAVMDLPGRFYLETVKSVFQDYDLPRGRLTCHGRLVDPAAIRRTFLLTVEGERDDICAVGQTVAAQDLCRSIRPYKKRHHVQTGVGHYGVFSGRRWKTEIYPIVREVIHLSA